MNSLVPVEEYIKQQASKIEKHLKASFPSDWDIPEVLRDSMNYSLMAGGKRLRPILVLCAVQALGQEEEAAIPVACAYEMIHTYSLIHDDLPSMDNDDYRRGKLTNHKVFGDAMAILAGDALLTHAFYMVTQSAGMKQVPSENLLTIIKELSIYCGAKGMVGGQVADILGEQGITDIRQLEYIHIHKTSDLIVGALRAGGLIAEATDEQLNALEMFGRNIGLAFQIQDDILDVIGNEDKLGKPINSDSNQNKVTYPYLISLEKSQKLINDLTFKGKNAIQQADFKYPERLLQIADFLMKRDH